MDSKKVKQRGSTSKQQREQPGSKGVGTENLSNVSKKQNQQSSNLTHSVIQAVFVSVLFFFLSSYLITDTWLWGYNGKYTNWHHWIPRRQIVLTQKELAQYDGTDLNKPIYLAIKGEVFDVTAGRSYYARGGGYGFFSGRDASRAYTTGCFETHLTHDLRGLTPAQISDIEGWASFYRNHPKYFKVGTVILDIIDPNSPIPEDCNKPVTPKPAS